MGGQRDDTSGRRCDRRGPARPPGSIPCSASPGSTRCRFYDALAGDAVDPAHPDPPRAGRRVRRRRLRQDAGSARASCRRRPARARSTRSPRSPRRGRTRRRSCCWPARSTPRSTAWAAASCTRRPTRAARSRRSPRMSAGRARPRRSRRRSPRRCAARWRAGRDRPTSRCRPTSSARRSPARRRRSRCPGRVAPDPDSIVAAARLLDGARRIVIMPGAGVHRANASRELRELAIRLGAPVATAVTGAGSIAADDDWCAGSVVAGRPEWTALFSEADAVVVVGSRLDDVGHRALDAAACRTSSTSTSIRPSSTAPTRRRSGSSATPGSRCAALLDELGSAPAGRSADPDWGVARARAMREAFDAGVAPDQRAVRDAFLAARAAMPRDAILTHDAARLNSWSGYFWPVYVPDGSIWPWGSATLGFALGVGERGGRRGTRPAGRGGVRRWRLPVHRDRARDDGRATAST